MRVVQFAVILAAAVTVGCSPDSPVFEPEASFGLGNSDMVPFKGTELVDAEDLPDFACPVAGAFARRFTVTSGHATHLGAYTGETTVCFLFVPHGPGPFGQPPFVFEHVLEEGFRVAANGDELYFSLDPVLGGRTSFTPGPAGPFSTFVNDITVDWVGGTGRFEGATGVVHITKDPGEAPAVWEGTISTVGRR